MKRIVISTFAVTLALTACGSRQGVPGTGMQKPQTFSIENKVRPERVAVKKGDTIYGIAYKYGITSRNLIAANKLQPPYKLSAGDELDLPAPQEHVVIDGETAAGIAAFYGVDMMVFARENRLDDSFNVKPGDRLMIPTRDTIARDSSLSPTPGTVVATSSLVPLNMDNNSGGTLVQNQGELDLSSEIAKEKLAGLDIQSELQREMTQEKNPVSAESVMKEASSEEDDSGSAVPLPPVKAVAATAGAMGTGVTKMASSSSSHVPTPIEKPIAASPPPAPVSTPGPAQVAPAGYGWPIRGEVISKFGDMIDGAKNDGINIAVAEGTSVKASAGGEVLHAGPLQSFGNLVLVKHSNGYMTAYGHNSKLLVKKGEIVQKGQKISEVGSTGDVNSPQLHFELRKGTEPIDPMPRLGS